MNVRLVRQPSVLLAAGLALLIAASASGCKVGERSLHLSGPAETTVGADADFSVTMTNGTYDRITWSVHPDTGATITREGIFTATKPGEYTVAAEAVMSDGTKLLDAKKITVTGSEATSPFAGTYIGSGDLPRTGTALPVHVDIEFVVDSSGNVTGKVKTVGLGFKWEADTKLDSGSVTPDGKVDAKGEYVVSATPNGQQVGSRGSEELTGRIDGTKFSGQLLSEGSKTPVKVTAKQSGASGS